MDMAHTSQGKVSEKNYFSRSGKSELILNLVSGFRIFNIKSEKSQGIFNLVKEFGIIRHKVREF